MRRKRSEFETYLPLAKLEQLLSGERAYVLVKVGEEHDGVQVVLRLSVEPAFGGQLRINGKEYFWDHGGCMVGDQGKGA
jgi:hypothetical protein